MTADSELSRSDQIFIENILREYDLNNDKDKESLREILEREFEYQNRKYRESFDIFLGENRCTN